LKGCEFAGDAYVDVFLVNSALSKGFPVTGLGLCWVATSRIVPKALRLTQTGAAGWERMAAPARANLDSVAEAPVDCAWAKNGPVVVPPGGAASKPAALGMEYAENPFQIRWNESNKGKVERTQPMVLDGYQDFDLGLDRKKSD
jgi:hypothetical protein